MFVLVFLVLVAINAVTNREMFVEFIFLYLFLTGRTDDDGHLIGVLLILVLLKERESWLHVKIFDYKKIDSIKREKKRKRKKKGGDICDNVLTKFVDGVGFSIRKRTQKISSFVFLVENFVLFLLYALTNNKNYEKPWIVLFDVS